MNILKRAKRFLLREDLTDRLSTLETKVFKRPDLIGFERIEHDETVEAWDDTGEVWPMHWVEYKGVPPIHKVEDDAKKINSNSST